MNILDGQKLSKNILSDIKEKVEKDNLKLKLAVVLIGDDSNSKLYIEKKKKACEKVGISFESFNLSEDMTQEDVEEEVKKIVDDKKNTAVMIQLPLPRGFDSQRLLNLVPSEKDVDVLSEESIGKLYTGSSTVLPPPIEGIRRLLGEYGISVRGKNVVVVGAGRLIGKPAALWLLREKATLSVVGSLEEDLSSFTMNADIIISGVGIPNLIKADMVKEGVIAIDAGTTSEGGRTVGDIDPDVKEKASYMAPVPGGVGPMTVACLIDNLVKLKEK